MARLLRIQHFDLKRQFSQKNIILLLFALLVSLKPIWLTVGRYLEKCPSVLCPFNPDVFFYVHRRNVVTALCNLSKRWQNVDFGVNCHFKNHYELVLCVYGRADAFTWRTLCTSVRRECVCVCEQVTSHSRNNPLRLIYGTLIAAPLHRTSF